MMFATPAILPRLEESGLFNRADLYQARFTASLYPAADQDLMAALAALVSLAVREGHVCLHLDNAQTISRLNSLGLGHNCKDQIMALAAPDQGGPLILSGPNLYFARFYDNEISLAQKIHALVQSPPDPFPLPAQVLGPALDDEGQPDWQTVATFAALRSRFCVISGGPGTGKTYTVARILDLATQINPQLAIGLAAPTGKAASRMTESLHLAFQGQLPAHLGHALKGQAQTIHRLLGWIPGRGCRYHQDHPLPLDLLIVDEVSMLDLELATRLVDALPLKACLIFLGDRYQLASVEAGGVLANICQATEVNHFSHTFLADWEKLTTTQLPETKLQRPLTDHVVELQKSRRFGHQSGIAQLATLIRKGQAQEAEAFLANQHPDLTYISQTSPQNLEQFLTPLIQEFFAPLGSMSDALQALQLFEKLRLLSPVHHGPWGTLTLNALVQQILLGKKPEPRRPWYPGRPIMILENDYALELFNGDIGLALPVNQTLRVFFSGPGAMRSFIPARLPRHETCYAMTVHKSQGSEYNHAVLVVPEEPCPVLSRELLYTALTRAKKHFTLCAPQGQIHQAILSPVLRDSGLKTLLEKRRNS